MSFLQKMQQRYTTKKFDTTRKLEIDKIKELEEILWLSPSSINSQPWKFIFVSNPSMKAKLARASYFNEQKIIDCNTLVVFQRINDISVFETKINNELPHGAIEYYNQFVKSNSDEDIKVWFDKQVYLSLGVLLSACAEMKIDATPMEGIDTKLYDTILDSGNYQSLVAVSIGYRDANDENQPSITKKSRSKKEEIIKEI
ncbi:MAG: nitroreductase family protein [Flavobacterium sp.]|uniref:nitroreductase family protein n=1 Tax=Flavobacterium sp. TaxID=239 RepID=UPI0025BF19C7|nr:nitroreductase family protein [Flavobacterium sp.]MCK6608127.1 nitroreductase family protein [Flavobacterium sp.]